MIYQDEEEDKATQAVAFLFTQSQVFRKAIAIYLTAPRYAGSPSTYRLSKSPKTSCI